MGCIYHNYEEECSLFEKDHPGSPQGCDKDGFCSVNEDPVPEDNCENYESDWSCRECGVDLNKEECECED